MAISAVNRALAETIDRERHRIESKGARASLAIGARARMLAYAAWRTTHDVEAVVRAIRAALLGSARLGQSGITALIAYDMTAAHLLGRRRTALIAGPQLRGVKLAAREQADLMLAADDFGNVGTATGVAASRRIVNVFTESIRELVKRLSLTAEEQRRLFQEYSVEAQHVLNEIVDHLCDAVRHKLIETQIGGVGARDGVKILGDVFRSEGFVPAADHTLEAIFRTQTQTAYAAGRFNAQQDPAVADVLWGYEYAAIMDDRVTVDICLPLNGMVREKHDPVWEHLTPPNHWNCRSTVLELFEPRKETPVPVNVHPQPGFDFNPGEVFRDNFLPRRLTRLSLANCGTGAGGFKPGNTCAAGGGGGDTKETAVGRAAVNAAVAELEKYAVAGANERRIIVDLHTGERLYEVSGERWKVELPDVSKRLGRENADLHTHPGDDSFSDGDWGTFAWSDVREMHVISTGHHYVLEKTAEYESLPYQKRSPRAVSERWNEIEQELEPAAFAKSPTPSRMVEDLIDETNRRMAAELKVRFVTHARGVSLSDCGANAPGGGGFQPGNTCAAGGGGGGSSSSASSAKTKPTAPWVPPMAIPISQRAEVEYAILHGKVNAAGTSRRSYFLSASGKYGIQVRSPEPMPTVMSETDSIEARLFTWGADGAKQDSKVWAFGSLAEAAEFVSDKTDFVTKGNDFTAWSLNNPKQVEAVPVKESPPAETPSAVATENQPSVEHVVRPTKYNEQADNFNEWMDRSDEAFKDEFGVPRPPLEMQNKVARWIDTLSDDESTAMADWFGVGYGRIQRVEKAMLKGEKIDDPTEKIYVKRSAAIDAALSRAPKYEGKVYRGYVVHGDEDQQKVIAQFPDGAIIGRDHTTSWSRSTTIAKSFGKSGYGAGLQVMLSVQSRSGRYVAPASNHLEEEIIMPRGRKFRVVRHELVEKKDPLSDKVAKWLNVELEELDERLPGAAAA